MKRFVLFVAAGLLGLAACTELGYVKPGMTEEQFVQDSQDCAEIARHQAFGDSNVFESRSRHRRSIHLRRHRGPGSFDARGSRSQIESRYRRLCMTSRGYELVPLEDEEDTDGP